MADVNKYTVPVLPTVPYIVKSKDGFDMHDSWKLYHEQLNKYLLTMVANEGLQAPHQHDDTITTLNTIPSVGKLLYNTVTNKLMVCEKTGDTTAVFKTVTTS